MIFLVLLGRSNSRRGDGGGCGGRRRNSHIAAASFVRRAGGRAERGHQTKAVTRASESERGSVGRMLSGKSRVLGIWGSFDFWGKRPDMG